MLEVMDGGRRDLGSELIDLDKMEWVKGLNAR